ncbi:MAG: NUDIX hydrolase [Planctomycetes bacterium]|nr:NUDIX hydrolase [Planctomycetota bacterium]
MGLPRILAGRVVHRNPYYAVSKVTADFGSFEKEYFVADHGSRAGVVVVRKARVLLVRQYRLLIRRRSWEIPGGGVRPRETPAAAAVRECREEAGVLCRNLRPLLTYHAGLDIYLNPTHVFHCRECEEVRGGNERRETTVSDWVPLGEAVDMIARREIMDAFTIIALLAYRRWARP